MKLLFCVLLFILVVVDVVVATTGCQVTTQLAAVRTLQDDGVLTTSMYAGHQERLLNLKISWQRPPPSATAATAAATLYLHPKHPLLENDVPDDWFDGRSALTLAPLIFSSHQVHRAWPVSATTALSDPTQGILYLGPTSPLWNTHSAVVFTGSQLHFIAKQPGQACTAMQALRAHAIQGDDSARHTTFYLDSPLRHHLALVDRTGNTPGQWNVTMHWDMDEPQTLIPVGAAALLNKDPHLTLVLDGRVALLSSAAMTEGHVVAPLLSDFSAAILSSSSLRTSSEEENQVVFGRRLLQELAVAWASDANGHVAMQMITISSSSSSSGGGGGGVDAIPEAVLVIAMILGLLLAWVSTYWTSFLASTLQLSYQPPAPASTVAHEDEAEVTEGAVVTRADVWMGWGIFILSVIAHALMGVYGGHDVLCDASLESPLSSFVLSHWIGTCIIGGYFLALLIFETARESQLLSRRLGGRRVVSIQLYSIAWGMMASRGVLAAVMVAGGTTLVQLAFCALVALIFVFFPSLYATNVFSIYLLSGTKLYLPRSSARWRDEYGVGRLLLLFLVMILLGLTVLLGVTLPLWLILPLLRAANGYYSEWMQQTTTLVVMSIPFFIASFALAKQVRQLEGEEEEEEEDGKEEGDKKDL